MNTFGWAIIGTGRIANTVAKEITATGRHKIVSVFSRTRSKAEKFAAKFGATVSDNVNDALGCEGVEAVYIATPHSLHYPFIIKCIASGVPVLSEKAFTVNSAQAQSAVNFANEKNVYLSEGMWTRYNPVVKQLRKWIDDGEIGEIKSVSASFCLPLKFTRPFVGDRVYKPEYAGGALLDLGVYPIAYAHMLLGVPDRIETVTRIEDGVDYDDKITLTYKNAVCKLNCSFDNLLSYRGVIEGTKGKIISPMFYKPNKATLINAEGKKNVRCKRGYIYQFDAVAEDVRAGKKQSEMMPQKDTVEVMKIMDEIRRLGGLEYPRDIEKAYIYQQ